MAQNHNKFRDVIKIAYETTEVARYFKIYVQVPASELQLFGTAKYEKSSYPSKRCKGLLLPV